MHIKRVITDYKMQTTDDDDASEWYIYLTRQEVEVEGDEDE